MVPAIFIKTPLWAEWDHTDVTWISEGNKLGKVAVT